MENSCNTSFAALAIELGADAMREQAEAFGFNSHYLDDLRPQARVDFPEDIDQPQTGQSGDRPVRRAPRPRCRWRWWSPGSPTAAW